MFSFKILEITNKNINEYIDQLIELEHKSNTDNREIESEIRSYIANGKKTLIVALDKNNKLQAATYINQSHIPFSDGDISKYFKRKKNYKEYLKKSYDSIYFYQKDMLEIYKLKIQAFKYAKDRILKENPQYEGNILLFLHKEIEENRDNFYKKSILRDKLYEYMYSYIVLKDKEYNGIEEKYQKFYWVNAKDIMKEFNQFGSVVKHKIIEEYENFMKVEQYEYHRIQEKSELFAHKNSDFETEKYYSANSENLVTIDKQITNLEKKNNGLFPIMAFEGIKKHLNNFFEDTSNKEIFLSAMTHRNDALSKQSVEFLEMKDSMVIQKRIGESKDINICEIKREDFLKYIENKERMLYTKYGYISNEEEKNRLKITRQKVLQNKNRSNNIEKTKYDEQNYTKSNKVEQDAYDTELLKQIENDLNNYKGTQVDIKNQNGEALKDNKSQKNLDKRYEAYVKMSSRYKKQVQETDIEI